MLVITLSSYFIVPILAIIVIAFLYVLYKNLCHVQILKHYEYVLPHLQSEVNGKEDQLSKLRSEVKLWEDRLDSIFVQILQWRMISDDYRALIGEMLPMLNNNGLAEAFALLEKKFNDLHLIFETDRQKYMAELQEKPGYEDEVNKVVSLMVEKFSGYGTGINAADSPLLNDDREN